MNAKKIFGRLTPDDVAEIAEIPATEVQLLWTDDFYDGPLSGIAEWAGQRFRIELVDWSKLGNEDELRRYWLITLSPGQLQEEERWQDLFCTHVWTGFDYTGRPDHHAPASEHSKFYEPFANRAEPDYSHNPVVGWFKHW